MAKKKEAAADTPAAEAPVEAPKANKPPSFNVYDKNGVYVRTYSFEQHGDNAEDLAAEYAKKIGGEVK